MVTILLCLLAGLGVYELVALKQSRGFTISELFWHAAYKHPLLPFALGLLCGHFVWQSTRCAELLGK